MPLFLGSTKVALNMGDRIGENINNQSKTITPTKSTQTVTPDPGYTGLSQVIVNAIPNSYIIPSGTYMVSTAGTANITSFSRLEVPGVAYPLVNISTYTNSDNYLISAKYSFQSSGFIGAGAQSFTTITIPGISSTTITPGSSSQLAVPRDRYTLGSIIVNAIPNEYKIVSGTITYSSAGTYNVANYSYVNIDLPVYNGELVR